MTELDGLKARLKAFGRDCVKHGDMTPGAARMLNRIADEMGTSTTEYDHDGNFEGHLPRACGEHRTVGSRAWCFDCGEWCYPDDGCIRCRHPGGVTLGPNPANTPDDAHDLSDSVPQYKEPT